MNNIKLNIITEDGDIITELGTGKSDPLHILEFLLYIQGGGLLNQVIDALLEEGTENAEEAIALYKISLLHSLPIVSASEVLNEKLPKSR